MIDQVYRPGEETYSPAEKIGELIAKTLNNDPSFYFFSPDETTSNRFSKIFEVEKRAWGDLPIKTWDLPEASDGRIVEMLSENVKFFHGICILEMGLGEGEEKKRAVV